MAITRAKKCVMLIWGFFECLFFSSLVLGWPWLTSILQSEHYFSQHCSRENESTSTSVRKCTDGAYSHQVAAENKNGVPLADRFDCHGDENGTSGNVDQKRHRGRGFQDNSSTLTPMSVAGANDHVIGDSNRTDLSCKEREKRFQTMRTLIWILRSAFTLPAGFFYDIYGTMRARLVAVLLFAVSSLMMTFSSSVVPWLVVPALTLNSIAGTIALMTNLQVANLFSSRRNTVMALYVGASHSSAILIFFMKASNFNGINVQTSFMFLTIGIVPMLVSTIAFLPKSRIPWPLPAGYEKRRASAADEPATRQPLTPGKTGRSKSRLDVRGLVRLVAQPIYLWSLLWFAINSLKISLHETTFHVMLVNAGASEESGRYYEELRPFSHLLCLLVSPCLGLLVDRARAFVTGSLPCNIQMQNILSAIVLASSASVTQSALSMAPGLEVHVVTALLTAGLHMTLVFTSLSFLSHVHFPQEHFGKLFGITIGSSAAVNLLEFPFLHLTESIQGVFYINAILLFFVLLTLGHPITVWRHCSLGLVRDTATMETDRCQKNLTPVVETYSVQSMKYERAEDVDAADPVPDTEL